MESSTPTRVQFGDRQFLQAADLQADQAYHRQARWRHNLALHSWGLLAGLEVSVNGDLSTAGVNVTPGMALDGYGRELVLPEGRSLRKFLNVNASYDVWLMYAEDRESSSKSRPRDCAGGTGAGRIVESPQLRITKTSDRQSPSPSQPDGVPARDWNFSPDRPVPAADHPWPVFLARLDFRKEAGEGKWVADLAERRYAGLIADRIAAPLSSDPEQKPLPRTVILNGADSNNPNLRFAVGTTTASVPVDLEANPPYLGIRVMEDKPQIELRAEEVSVAGDLVLRDGSAIQFEPNPIPTNGKDVHAEGLQGQRHWRMYHHFTAPEPITTEGLEQQPPPSFADELRITMPSLPAGGNSVVIGYFGDKGKFEPVLAVRDDHSVEVYGNLKVVGGKITGLVNEVPAGTAGGVGGGVDPTILKTKVGEYVKDSPGKFSEILQTLLTTGALEVGDMNHVLTDSGDARLKEIATWLFEPAKVRSRNLVAAMPIPATVDKTNIDAFAAALWASKPQLETLIDALVREAPANPTADVGDTKIVDLLAAWLAKKAPAVATRALVAETQDQIVMEAFFVDGRLSNNLERVGKVLRAKHTPERLKKLVGGMESLESLSALAKEMIDSISVNVRHAIPQALIDGLDPMTAPTTLASIPGTVRLRQFLRNIKLVAAAGDTGFIALRDALKILVENMDESSF